MGIRKLRSLLRYVSRSREKQGNKREFSFPDVNANIDQKSRARNSLAARPAARAIDLA